MENKVEKEIRAVINKSYRKMAEMLFFILFGRDLNIKQAPFSLF